MTTSVSVTFAKHAQPLNLVGCQDLDRRRCATMARRLDWLSLLVSRTAAYNYGFDCQMQFGPDAVSAGRNSLVELKLINIY